MRIRLFMLVVAVVRGLVLTGPVQAAESVMLAVPYRTQLDDSPFARANRGPASLGMVLGAFGIAATNGELRDRVNELQGTWDDVTASTVIQNMAAIGRRYGLRPLDLVAGQALMVIQDRGWYPQGSRL